MFCLLRLDGEGQQTYDSFIMLIKPLSAQLRGSRMGVLSCSSRPTRTKMFLQRIKVITLSLATHLLVNNMEQKTDSSEHNTFHTTIDQCKLILTPLFSRMSHFVMSHIDAKPKSSGPSQQCNTCPRAWCFIVSCTTPSCSLLSIQVSCIISPLCMLIQKIIPPLYLPLIKCLQSF